MRALVTMAGCTAFAFLAGAAFADKEVENFAGGEFTNPFFIHDLEFDGCCWEIIENANEDWEFHLVPNTDFITFDLEPGQKVESVSCTIRDFEGGFVGNVSSSVMIARSSTDFVVRIAQELIIEDTLLATVDDIGQLFGEPLGEIVQIQLQAANEGNALEPGIGAYYDDITVVFADMCAEDLDGDGAVGSTDLIALLGVWGRCDEDCPADFDGDEFVGPTDLIQLLGAWGPCE